MAPPVYRKSLIWPTLSTGERVREWETEREREREGEKRESEPLRSSLEFF